MKLIVISILLLFMHQNAWTQSLPSTTFGTFAAINKQYFAGPHTIVPPTTNNSSTIVYTSDNTAVATISGSVITFTGIGTATITATQAADANYEGGTVSTLLTVLGKDLVSKYGGISSTDVNYVNANGKVGGGFGVDKYGAVQDAYEELVTLGLIMYLDAGNPASYSGTGTTWTDISGNGNHGILFNGVGYTSANSGALVFDGADDQVRITNDQVAQIGGSNHTITAWVNNDIVTEEDFISTGTGMGSVLLMIFRSAGGGVGGFRGHAWSSTGNANTIDSPRAIGTGSWNMLTQRVSWGGSIDLFENGVLINTRILSGGAPPSSKTQLIIGCRSTSGGGSSYDGKIAQVSIYNRALSAKEIQQNYDATKSRYGL